MKDLLHYEVPPPCGMTAEQGIHIYKVLNPPPYTMMIVGGINQQNHIGLLALDRDNNLIGPVSPEFITNHDLDTWLIHKGIDPRFFTFICLEDN